MNVKRIRDEGNRKRSEAAKEQPRTQTGFAPKQVTGQSVPVPQDDHPSKQARAAASKTNPGAVARGDKLAARRPDLAEKVRNGDIEPAEAHRQMKRDEANRKRSEAVREKERTDTGTFKPVVEHSDPPVAGQHQERMSKAAASKTNPGAVAIRRRKVTVQYIALRAAIERFAEKRAAEGKV